MADEIQFSYQTGQTLTAALFDADPDSETSGYVWDGSEYVAVGSLSGTDWRITISEIGSTGEYRGSLPDSLVGTRVRVKVMAGATPSIGDEEVLGGIIEEEAGGGGGVTEEELEEEIDQAIAAARVTGGGGLNPVQEDLTLVVSKGTEYTASNNRAAQWTVEDWGGPSLDDNDTVTLRFTKTEDYDAGDSTADLEVSGTASDVDGDGLFTVPLTSANLASLESVSASTPAYNYRYTLLLNLSGGAKHEITRNAATIRPAIATP